MDATLLVFTDGRRECISEAIPSALEHLKGATFTERWIIDDSANPEYAEFLGGFGFDVVSHPERLGFGETIRTTWAAINEGEMGSAPWVFHLEDDFTFDTDVHLDEMADVLTANKHLAQMALLRHAYFPREIQAGSIINEHPESYRRRRGGRYRWLEHRRYFTTNPCLYRREVTGYGWPVGDSSEQTVTRNLREHGYRFAYWGHAEELVTHIGSYRLGTGY